MADNEGGNLRVYAIQSLIQTLHNQYPKKGFSISDKLQFIHTTDRGICILAKQSINKDETLMTIPEKARLSSVKLVNSSKKMLTLRNKMKKNAPQRQKLQGYLEPEDFMLALQMMKALAKRSQVKDGSLKKLKADDPDCVYIEQAATWPTEDEMKEMSWFYWDLGKVKKIWNVSTLWFSFFELKNHVQFIFNTVLHPFFRANNPKDYIDPTLPSNIALGDLKVNEKKALLNTYIYAISLAWSRSHQDGTGKPDMIPLVELFNGTSEKMNDRVPGKKQKKSAINVDIARGYWPFIRGDAFINQCNLACSSVYASRDIDAGEELIISFGDVTPTGFSAKYGEIPLDFLHHWDVVCDVQLWCPPKFVPTDKLRIRCLEKSDYPLDILSQTKGDTALISLQSSREPLGDNVDVYRWSGYKGYEPEGICTARQYLILAVLADDYDLKRNFNSGRLRGGLYETKVLPLLSEVVNYNIKLLSGGKDITSAEDAEKALHPDTPKWEKSCLLARVAYRESLLMWRYAFLNRKNDTINTPGYKEAMRMQQPPLDFPEFDEDITNISEGLCKLCGRSYPVKMCSGCNQVQYCSRGHQLLDWGKNHKNECGKMKKNGSSNVGQPRPVNYF